MVRLGRFDKWGYKNSFSKGELARELVYMHQDCDTLKNENQKYKEVIDKLNNLNNRIIEEYKLNYGDNPSKLLLALNTISDILKEVE